MRNSVIILLLLVGSAQAADNPCAGKKTRQEFHACVAQHQAELIQKNKPKPEREAGPPRAMQPHQPPPQ